MKVLVYQNTPSVADSIISLTINVTEWKKSIFLETICEWQVYTERWFVALNEGIINVNWFALQQNAIVW